MEDQKLNTTLTTQTINPAENSRHLPWWVGAVIYQIYPRSFLDTNGDGIGDLPGITRKLDYIADLGVEAIWLSPFFTSPMRDFGYDVSDYCDVDPMFGTLTDFNTLIEKAHRLKLKVIIDQVYSHTSDQHAWFEESGQDTINAKRDWYVWADPKGDGSPPNNWHSVFGGGAWEWDNRRQQYYLHNFLTSQPDLNLHNVDVQDALLSVAKFWLDKGVDGFRLDAINFAMHDPALRDNPPSQKNDKLKTRPFDYQQHQFNQSHDNIPQFLQRVRSLTDQYTDIFTVAEVAGPDPLSEMKAFTKDNRHLTSAYSFAFLYAETFTHELTQRTLEEWPGGAGEGWPSWAFSNHDAPRAISRWADKAKEDEAAKFFALVLLALRGNAFIYQGEELGLPQAHVPFEQLQDPEAILNWPHTLGRDGARTPIPWDTSSAAAGFTSGDPWLPIADAHHSLCVSVQETDPSSVLQFIRTLIKIRKDSRALRAGNLTFIENGHDLLAFNRKYDTEELLCVFNGGNKALTWHPPIQENFQRLVYVGENIAGDGRAEILKPLSGFIAVKKK